MATLNKAAYEAKYNDAGVGVFKIGQTRGIGSEDARALVEDSADSVPFTSDDSYTWPFPQATATGTDTYAATLAPVITAYSTSQKFQIKFTNASSAVSTLNLNAVGAKKIFVNPTTQATVAHIVAGQISLLVYDAALDTAAGGFLMIGAPPTSGGGTWGSITGTLADQTDLQTAIDDKVGNGINDGVTTIAPSQNAVFDALALKQDTLVSATNIKTINSSTLLGSGDITLEAAGTRNDVTLANGVVTIDWAAGDIQNLTITEAKVITAISNPVITRTILLIIPGTNSLTFSGLTAVIEGTYLTGVTNRIYIQCIKVSGGAEYRITYDNGVSPYPFSVITSTTNVTAWAITTNEWFSKRTLTLTENSTFSLSGAANGYQGECWVTASGAQRTVSIPAGAGHIMIGVGDGTAKNIIIESGEIAVVFWSFNGTTYLWGYNLE